MALTPVELVVIAVVVIVFVMWGPKKIPELARALGIARKEFNESLKDAQTTASSNAAERPQSTGDTLTDTARKLGITTEGMSRDQISQEIVNRARGSS